MCSCAECRFCAQAACSAFAADYQINPVSPCTSAAPPTRAGRAADSATASMNPPQISIIIKALNEQRRIAACIESALVDAAALRAEVIVVDSLSTDDTVAIARRYPVRIVQFARKQDIGCGAAVQMGYQFARGRYLYVLDADMALQRGFIALALARLQADAGLAGVGGKVIDSQVLTASDQRRRVAAERLTADVEVKELGGGGLYRREAVEQTGYLGHQGLYAFEEAELGARLRSGGWRLLRLAAPAVMHEGHAESDVTMLRRLWRNGRARAGGAVLRSAWGRPWLVQLARKQAHLLAMPLAHVLALLAALGLARQADERLLVWGAVWLVVALLLALRKRSLPRGLWTLVESHFFAVAAMLGLLARPRSPHAPMAGQEITSP